MKTSQIYPAPATEVNYMEGAGSATAKTDEKIIRDLDAEWSRAAENKDAVKFAAFYSATGSAMPF